MTSETFAQRIVAMQDTLYRVSYGLLSRACGREDGTKSNTTFVQTESLNLTELPGSVTVRGYDCWEKTRFGQHTFTADK